MKDGITIITIVLNGESFIEETIKSVIQQENVNYEYIIIDGGSTDGTLDKISLYKSYIKHLVSEKDGGIYQAINKGISLARFQLIGLIHCGDCYTSNALSDVYEVFKKYNADIVYGDIEMKEEFENKSISKRLFANHELLKKEMSIFHPSTFVNHSMYEKYGFYDVSYRLAADYDLFLGLFLKNRLFIHIPKVIAVFRDGGISSSHLCLSLKENYLIRKKKIGVINAINFTIKRFLFIHFFNIRKNFVLLLVGEKNYFYLKNMIRKTK